MRQFKVKYGSCQIDELTGGVLFLYRDKKCYMNKAGKEMDINSVPWCGSKLTLDEVVYQVANQLQRQGACREFLKLCFLTSPQISEDTRKAIGDNDIFSDAELQSLYNTILQLDAKKRLGVINALSVLIKSLK
jgi:hypothetical protein